MVFNTPILYLVSLSLVLNALAFVTKKKGQNKNKSSMVSKPFPDDTDAKMVQFVRNLDINRRFDFIFGSCVSFCGTKCIWYPFESNLKSRKPLHYQVDIAFYTEGFPALSTA